MDDRTTVLYSTVVPNQTRSNHIQRKGNRRVFCRERENRASQVRGARGTRNRGVARSLFDENER
jgi:hypothetical protein